jgi:hypothetical protein
MSGGLAGDCNTVFILHQNGMYTVTSSKWYALYITVNIITVRTTQTKIVITNGLNIMMLSPNAIRRIFYYSKITKAI